MLSLKLINKDVTPDEIKLLAKWRKKVQPIWGETFKITYEGTKKWIHGIVDNPDKMLFFVVKNNRPVGHVGYDHIGLDYCFIGNVIRGAGKKDGSITKSIQSLIKLSKQFGKKGIYIDTIITNKNAIRFYKKRGFVEFKKNDKILTLKLK